MTIYFDMNEPKSPKGFFTTDSDERRVRPTFFLVFALLGRMIHSIVLCLCCQWYWYASRQTWWKSKLKCPIGIRTLFLLNWNHKTTAYVIFLRIYVINSLVVIDISAISIFFKMDSLIGNRNPFILYLFFGFIGWAYSKICCFFSIQWLKLIFAASSLKIIKKLY